MSTFAEFITNCVAQIENYNDRTTPYLRRATCRWLLELSNKRTLEMESTFSFATLAAEREYGPGHPGFPVDAMQFDTVYGIEGSGISQIRRRISGPKPIADVREAYAYGGSGVYPSIYAWHHQKMIFGPVPSGAVTIEGDYFKSATRDTATGDLITVGSTTHTNPWFERGEMVLMNFVLADYYSSIAKDKEAAALCTGMGRSGLDTLMAEHTARKTTGGQAANYFGPGG